MLLSQGASAVFANSCGWTALHQASYYGQMEVCKALVQADPTVISKRNYFGASAIDTAVAGGNIETIRLGGIYFSNSSRCAGLLDSNQYFSTLV